MGGLSLSSIGLGTYLGGEDASTDAGYEASVAVGARLRDQRLRHRDQLPRPEERAGHRPRPREGLRRGPRRARRGLRLDQGRLSARRRRRRARRRTRRYWDDTFSSTGLAPEAEIAQGCHCIAPGYLADQIERSRREPRPRDDRPLLPAQRRDAARRGRADDLPDAPRGGGPSARGAPRRRADRGVGARDLGRPARAAGAPRAPVARRQSSSSRARSRGEEHHFRGVQLPFNLAMARRWASARRRTARSACRRSSSRATSGLAAFGSASILQGRLAGELPDEIADAFPEARTAAQQALQFSRSAPGMTAALVGVSSLGARRGGLRPGAHRARPTADAVLGLFR